MSTESFHKKKYIVNSPNKTQGLGNAFAKKIGRLPCRKNKKNAFIIGLVGNLGSGKTKFVQGFAKGLSIKKKINSPTFIIMKKYRLEKKTQNLFKNFFHIDAYRLRYPKELMVLGFEKIRRNKENVVLIEWAEFVRAILPKKIIWVNFEVIGKNSRRITIYK